MTLYEAIRRVNVRDVGGAGFRATIGVAAVKAFGPDIESRPPLINVAALAVAMGSDPIIHELKRDAIELIYNTDVRSVPVILATADGRPFFGDTTEIGYYPMSDESSHILLPGEKNQPNMRCFVGIAGHDVERSIFAPWIPHLGEDRIEIPMNRNPLISNPRAHKEWCDQAFPFVLVYALLFEAEKTPIEVVAERRHEKKSVKIAEQKKGRSGWTIQHISLTERAVYALADRPPEPREENWEIDDKIAKEVRVRGFLRRQACGPEHGERKWIYVEPFDSTRWMNPGPRRVVVDK